MMQWKLTGIRARAAGLQADPYYEWAVATNFAYYGSTSWLPILIELRDAKGRRADAHAFAARVLRMQRDDKKKTKDRRSWASQLRIPAFYASRPRRLSRPTRFLSVLATKMILQAIYRGAEPSDSIRAFEIGHAARLTDIEKRRQQPRQKPNRGKATRPRVVVGVIDDGLAFAHERFKKPDGTTRIEYLWDQQEPHPDWYFLGYGREYRKKGPDGIDDRLIKSRHGALVDEDELYRRSGHLDQAQAGHKPLAFQATHGTHVMDLASNPGAVPPVMGTQPIVGVQLPTSTVADTSGGTLRPQILNGLWYIIAKADEIAAEAGISQLPIVVNVSYGLIAGPHDGSSKFEAALDDLLVACNSVDASGAPTTPPLRVVMPAGNSYLARCHACLSLQGGASQTLQWRVLPDDWTESFLEIWFPAGFTSLPVAVAAPGGGFVNVAPGAQAQMRDGAGNVIAQVSNHIPGDTNPRGHVRMCIAPTASPDGRLPLAPAGLWQIRIDNTDGAAEVCDIHAWIQRDDTAPGYRQRGRQSFFDDPEYCQYDDGGRPIEDDGDPRTLNSYVKRCGTLNAIATGREPVVVAGLRRSDWRPAPYSAAGWITECPSELGGQDIRVPDVMTASDDSPSHYGLLAAGARSGSSAAMQGTSVASPQIACWIADELAAGRSGDRNAVQNLATAVNAPRYNDHPMNRPPGAAPQPGPERGGAGRVEFVPQRPEQRAERE